MATHEKHQAVERSLRIYRRLLAFYPKAHRDAYGKSMAQLFGDQCRDAWNHARSWGLLRLWLRVLPDLVKTSLWEHISTLKGKRSMSEEISDIARVPAAPWQVFKRVFGVVFLLVFVSTVVVTFMLPKTYEGRSVVMLRTDSSLVNRTNSGVNPLALHYNPFFLQTEFKVIQSGAVLTRVIEKLELNRRWKRYANGTELQTSQSLEILKRRVTVRSLNFGEITEISVFDEAPAEAADIANAIVESYINNGAERTRQAAAHNNKTLPGPKVNILDFAAPAQNPARPNKPRNIVLGAFGGILLAVAAGVITLGIRSAIRRIRRPKFAAP